MTIGKPLASPLLSDEDTESVEVATSAASDQVYQLLAHGRWFSPGTPASSNTKTGRHDTAEILLKVALKPQKSKSNQSLYTLYINYMYLLESMIYLVET